MRTFVAFPSASPGGLDAALGMHFGKSSCFTVVEVEDGQVRTVTVAPGIPHEHGGCTAPVQMLSSRGVTAIVCGGMGMRPLTAMAQAGITVYHAGFNTTVAQCLDAYLKGTLLPFGADNSCSCHHRH